MDAERIRRTWSGELNVTTALRPHQAGCERERLGRVYRHVILIARDLRTEAAFLKNGLKIRRLERWIALAKEREFRGIVARALRLRIGPHASRDQNMILQIPADAAQMLLHRNAMPRKLNFVADAGQHQNLGRVDRAERQDNFATGMRDHLLAFARERNIRRPTPIKKNTLDFRAEDNGQVRLVHTRPQIRTGRRNADCRPSR